MDSLSRVHVHATFSVSEPVPFFLAAVEVLDGMVEPGMFVNIPLTPDLALTVRVLSTSPVQNDFGLELLGVVLDCGGDADRRQLLECLNIGDETWEVTVFGCD
jgi:hypothetical protein